MVTPSLSLSLTHGLFLLAIWLAFYLPVDTLSYPILSAIAI